MFLLLVGLALGILVGLLVAAWERDAERRYIDEPIAAVLGPDLPTLTAPYGHQPRIPEQRQSLDDAYDHEAFEAFHRDMARFERGER